MVVPEERHLLLQRTLAVHHPEQPPLPGVVDVASRLESACGSGGHADVARRPDLCVDVVGEAFEAEQAVDGRHVGHRRVARDVFLDRAERRAPRRRCSMCCSRPLAMIWFLPNPGRRRG